MGKGVDWTEVVVYIGKMGGGSERVGEEVAGNGWLVSGWVGKGLGG